MTNEPEPDTETDTQTGSRQLTRRAFLAVSGLATGGALAGAASQSTDDSNNFELGGGSVADPMQELRARIYTGTLAERDSAGVKGRFYVVNDPGSADDGDVYYDNGSSWVSEDWGSGSSSSGDAVLSDSGTDTADGGNEYVLPQIEDAINLQGGGEIQNAESVSTDTATVTTSLTDAAGVSHTGELADDGDTQPPEAHAIGGSAHNSDTLANVNALVSDATLDDSSSSRPPNSHDNAAHSVEFVSDGDGTTRQIWVIASGASDPAGADPEDIIFEEQ